ncbi:hypothetical protein EIP91_002125 [Steccherinum ochraceum]|uniref:Uncharacterized protein n=1 Tax=Steccherinum ochraceum TaxID=92696 RepID=A0A4R0RGH0_9APHY|nr:hypothetical protein EIP91_002125 [Steccherinum ochraceum]
MTAVSNDMVHYGTHGRTKNVSEAKLNTVLQTTRQRKDGFPPGHPSDGVAAPLANLSNSPSFDDGSALTIMRKKHKSSSSKDATR